MIDATTAARRDGLDLDRGESGAVADLVVEQARGGDMAAFEALVRRHERQVFRLAWRYLGRPEDAQDVAQEVFLRLHRSLRRWRPSCPLGPWLCRVTINVCRDHWRRRQRRAEVPLAALTETPREAEQAPDPGRRALAVEESGIVAEGLLTLSGKERAAILLRDVEGLPTSRVAAVLGSSETTVRSHICRARLKLRRHRERRLGKEEGSR